MNKKELVNAIADKTGLSIQDSKKTLDETLNIIIETLKNKDSVRLIGFGTFKTISRAKRDGRNPKTGEKIKIKASVVPKFQAGKELKEATSAMSYIKTKGAVATKGVIASSDNAETKSIKAKKAQKSKSK